MKYAIIKNNSALSGMATYMEQVEPHNWRHTLTSKRGYDSCSFDVYGERPFLEELFYEGLGRRVQRFSPDGEFCIFEGFINSLTLNEPGLRASASLDDLWNRVSLRYTSLGTGSNPPSETATTTADADDTDSQARYGIKELVYRPPNKKMTSTMAAYLRDVILGNYSQPRRSADVTPNDAEPHLNVHVKGYMHTLAWRAYNYTAASGTDELSDQIGIIALAVGEFIDSVQVDRNTIQVNRYYNDDDTALSIIDTLGAVGDASNNRWVCQVYEDRILRYKMASQTIDYFRQLSDPKHLIHNSSFKNVPFWEVRPDAWLRTTDIAPMEPDPTNFIDDYRLMYIESIEWHENTNTITLRGSVGEDLQSVIARLADYGEFKL